MSLPNGLVRADLLLVGDRIQSLIDPASTSAGIGTSVDEVIDADGLVVLPGLIDCHVHFATGTAHCDTLQDVTRAGALGGITTIVGHVWSPDGDIVGEIDRQREQVADCPIDVAFHAILTAAESQPEVLRQLVNAGVRSFKFFMAYTERGLGVDDPTLYKAFRLVANAGGVALVHAEHGGMIAAFEQELMDAGDTAITDFPASRPLETEVDAIRRAMWFAQAARCPLYVVHVSSASGIRAIIAEKKRRHFDEAARVPIYAETCPKYILLDEGLYETLGNIAKVAPPLRGAQDRTTLYQALVSGWIDTLGSDHAPYRLESKSGASFMEVRTGAPGIQTAVPVMLAKLLSDGIGGDGGTVQPDPASVRELAFTTLQRTLSLQPAKIFGLYPRKGWIGPGADADIVIVDPDATWHITREWELSHSGFSLYDGWPIRGKPVHSLVRGRWVLQHGRLVAQGGGRYLAR